MHKLAAILKISRPENVIITFIAVIVGAIVSTGINILRLDVIWGTVSLAFACAAGNVINDIYDFEIDKINKPDRVLPSARLSVPGAKIIYAIELLFSIALSLTNGLFSLVFVLVVNILLYLYSADLKKRILFSNFTVALLTSSALIYGGQIAGNITGAIIPAVFAFLINFIREIIKDMEDTKGDSAKGVLTFPNKFGFVATKRIIYLVTFVLILATLYPFLFKIYNIEYFIVVMVLVNPVLIYFLKSLIDNDSPKNLKKLSFILKLNMLFGIIAIYLGI
jgi:geranylgeranylglycerol-phosphate geranylgeranyltransferase